ncbi:MAG: hypothetical protein AB8B87_24625 [Granulosicoccus sp.]
MGDHQAFSHQYLILDDGMSLDFTGAGANNTADLEYIDMVGGAGETMTLTAADVIDMTNANDSLIILGDAADTLNIVGAEATGSQQSIQCQTYGINALGDAQILVLEDVGTIVI